MTKTPNIFAKVREIARIGKSNPDKADKMAQDLFGKIDQRALNNKRGKA